MKRWHLLVVIILLVLWALWDHHGRTVAEARAEAQTDSAQVARASVDSLLRVEDSLRGAYRTDTLTLTRWRTRWDSIVGPGRTDTLTLERVVAVADTTIRACTAALHTCEARVAAATERGDSALSVAAHWEAAAGQWKKVARGPFAVLAVEATTTLAWKPAAAAEATLGRSHLKALGRVEVQAGDQSCAFSNTQDVYSCSTTGTVTARVGARWVF